MTKTIIYKIFVKVKHKIPIIIKSFKKVINKKLIIKIMQMNHKKKNRINWILKFQIRRFQLSLKNKKIQIVQNL